MTVRPLASGVSGFAMVVFLVSGVAVNVIYPNINHFLAFLPYLAALSLAFWHVVRVLRAR